MPKETHWVSSDLQNGKNTVKTQLYLLAMRGSTGECGMF